MIKEKVDLRDLILAIVAFNKRVEGRTFLQKLAYFLNEKLTLGINFEPYFYGPYSESLALTTNTLVELDFLEELEERFPSNSTDIFEQRRYIYKLTKAGNKIFAELNRQNLPWLNEVKKSIANITAKQDCNYECLSLSAKMYHILKRQQRPMTETELSLAAEELSWKLSKEKVERAAKFLKDLELIKQVS